MRYFKAIANDGRILGVGKTSSNTARNEITAEEYEVLSRKLADSPGGGFALYEDGLEWKPYTADNTVEELSDSEALSIIVGGDST